ncbi:DUF3068 domain-containing protein [Micromonospora endolithica]|uniref:DUF3068 domain-containing protein n=1 Tax=Micromonospora endolithica TaxID=230091 RepID=A0A3A9YR29_9ACTN|nr:DUF3068 domain-containing protein [Micromonospora endolithica]RKN37716.1 DUF3068 domain-containing protein [Micromonospora endolithica]TWJ25327.1 Protein of unknown function (DUF3068) [Micromonospora endolithica]
MKHRAIGAVLFGGGVLLLALAAGLVFVVKPAMTKLPYDLKPTTSVAEAKGATFLQITNGNVEINQADLKSTVLVSPNPKATSELTGDLDGKAVVWEVGQTVDRTDRKELINAYGAALALDRVSGSALEWEKEYLDDSGTRQDVNFSGQMYKFPFNTEKKTYEIFDRDLRAKRPAEFKGTEDIQGIEAYRFEQVIADETLDLAPDRLAVLLPKLAPGATSGELKYSNTRTVWIDPVTGSFLNVREVQRKTLVPNTGAPVDVLNADFAYNEETIKGSVERAKDSRNSLNLLGVYAPVGAALLGLVLILAGLLVGRQGATVAAGEARHRAEPAPVADPTPTRVDQEPVRDDTPTAEQPRTEPAGGVLSDEIPPASTNWKGDDSSVPHQRPSTDDEAEKR